MSAPGPASAPTQAEYEAAKNRLQIHRDLIIESRKLGIVYNWNDQRQDGLDRDAATMKAYEAARAEEER